MNTKKDAGIHQTILGSGVTTFIISSEEMDDTIKILKSLKDIWEKKDIW